MNFKIVPTKLFLKQIESLDKKSKELIKSKINLISQNPFRYKKIHSKEKRVHRVRLNINNKETRLIYQIVSPELILVCLLERKNNYKDLEKYLSDIMK